MASPGFLSDAQAMTRAVTGFAECAANAKSTMSQLESDLLSTLSQYKGDQAVAFFDLQTKLQEKMQQANRELDIMSQLVNDSFRNYNTGDTNAAQSIRTLAGSVDAGGAVLGRLTGA